MTCICVRPYVSIFSSKASSLGHQVSVHSDPRLFTDDVDIRFSRTLNSCKLPQVRYATPERLLQRLTGKNILHPPLIDTLCGLIDKTLNISDLRFLSIDFLNTFLLTYRVFTDGETVLNALKKVFYESQPTRASIEHHFLNERLNIPGKDDGPLSPRRTSGASSVSG